MTKQNFTQILILLTLFSFYSCDKSESYSITDHYIACGWMECGASEPGSIELHESWAQNAQSRHRRPFLNVVFLKQKLNIRSRRRF